MGARSTGRRVAGWAVAMCATAILGSGLAAQPAARGSAGDWQLRRNSGAELWFHGLAVIGYDAPGALPYYDPAYAARVRRDKRWRGLAPTTLDRTAPRLLAALRRDSAFEVLHFVPLYFPAAPAPALLTALHAVARGDLAAARGDPRVAFGAAAVASVLTTPAQRAVLDSLVTALDDEWQRFLDAEQTRRAAEEGRRISALQAAWDERFAPGLAPYLHALALDQGVILVAPALGGEGRLFRGDPRNPADNVVAVQLTPATPGGNVAPLFHAVRELCFPIVERVLASGSAAGEVTSGRAAVQCGGWLLDAAAPALAADYRRTFLGAAAGTLADAELERALAAVYPIDAALTRALRDLIPRLPTAPVASGGPRGAAR